MKKLVLIFLISLTYTIAFAQQDTSIPAPPADTADTAQVKKTLIIKPVKRRVITDTTRKSKGNLVSDTTKKRDSLQGSNTLTIPAKDSGAPAISKPANIPNNSIKINKPIDSFYLKLLDNPFFKTRGKPVYLVISERKREYKDEIFYLLAGLLFLLAFIKLIFSRYFKNMFRLFFQPSFRQKQTREQLQQSSLPSLLLNLFFVFSAGAYISFLLAYYHLIPFNFWWVLLYTTLFLLVLYLGKFIFLSFAGWVFNVKEATDSYIFSVYLINKIIGVVLIPFTLIIAFSKPDIINISITVSLLIIVLLFLYRYFVSFGTVRREVKVNVLHFFFYIFAFEITPLLLIYKTLIIYLNKSL